MCHASFVVLRSYRGPAPFHRLTPNKRFEPVFSTVIMAVCSLFNRMLLLTDLIPVHLLYCGQTVMIGCNHTSFEWTRAVRHIYGIIRHMQGLYFMLIISQQNGLFYNLRIVCKYNLTFKLKYNKGANISLLINTMYSNSYCFSWELHGSRYHDYKT